jgi:hypothetical protein
MNLGIGGYLMLPFEINVEIRTRRKEQSRACSANLNEPLNGFSGFDYRREDNFLAATVRSIVA